MKHLIDPRLKRSVESHWPSKCTIVAARFRTAESGQQILDGYSPIAWMTNIPCALGPIIQIRPTDDEVRVMDVQENYVRRQLNLNGYFPLIQVRLMLALVDGVYYPIRGVEHDSQKFCSRLKVEVITP